MSNYGYCEKCERAYDAPTFLDALRDRRDRCEGCGDEIYLPIWDREQIFAEMADLLESLKANARLIAAAPEMADMLKRCVSACDDLDSDDRTSWPTINDARALLARINGDDDQHEPGVPRR